MLNPKLYKNSGTYDFFMKLLGYQRSIDRFLRSLDLELPINCRILDAGCGTGIVGLHFMRRYREATLLATDLERSFLTTTLDNAYHAELEMDNIRVGIADISEPRKVTAIDGKPFELEPASFDLICVGAVVGYSNDTQKSLEDLVGLLSPGGYLLNLEMNESPSGRYVSHRYRYKNLSVKNICEVLQAQGCDVQTRKFRIHHLPAKLTRVAIVAHKTNVVR